jgi:hypothetical protein
MRNLCTNEIGGIKMKKNEKKVFWSLKNRMCFYCSFWAAPLALYSQDDL